VRAEIGEQHDAAGAGGPGRAQVTGGRQHQALAREHDQVDNPCGCLVRLQLRAHQVVLVAVNRRR
jgi:hypothetical protein